MRLDRSFSKMHPTLIFTILITLSLHIPSAISMGHSVTDASLPNALGTSLEKGIKAHSPPRWSRDSSDDVADNPSPLVRNRPPTSNDNAHSLFDGDEDWRINEDGDTQPLLQPGGRRSSSSDHNGQQSSEKSAQKENTKGFQERLMSFLKGAYVQIREYATSIYYHFLAWRKSPRVPLFNEAKSFDAFFKPYFEKMEKARDHGELLHDEIAKIVNEMVGEEGHDPYRFYTSEHQKWAQKYEQEKGITPVNHLKETLTNFCTRLWNAKSQGIISRFENSRQQLLESKEMFHQLLIRKDDKPNHLLYARRLRDLTKKMEPLRRNMVKHDFLELYLELFRPAKAGGLRAAWGMGLEPSEMILQHGGSNEFREINPTWEPKTELELKTLEWQLPESKIRAIYDQHDSAYAAFQKLYKVQSAENDAARTGAKLSTHYQEERSEAMKELDQIYEQLLPAFGTEEELKQDFASIRTRIKSLKLADKKDSPLEWALSIFMEPAGPGRAIQHLQNFEQLARALKIDSSPLCSADWTQAIYDTTPIFANHYHNAHQIRALRLEFEGIFNEKGQREFRNTPNKLYGPGEPNSGFGKRK